MKNFLLKTCLTILGLLVGVGTLWAEEVKLTQSCIYNNGTGAGTGYSEQSLTDENGNKWDAYAIKNYHSKDTKDQYYLQIKKYASNVAYYIHVPTLGTKITQLKMTVSGASQPMVGGGNSTVLYFSSSKSTSSLASGVVRGTGSEEITIDASSLNLNTGYITASAAIRIWDITVTYETGGSTPITLQSLTISGKAANTTYTEGDKFDPAGLTVTGTYSDNLTATITEGITWNVTPETLTAGTTSVSVTATVNNVTSAAYTVDGLTVNAITEKSIADFIASEGGKCYLIGTVSAIKNTTYGNYTLTDGSGSIYVYGTLTPNGEAQKFASLGIDEGNKIKVLANEYELFNGTQEAKNVIFVEKLESDPVTKYTITIANDIANGTVTANTKEAAEGVTVTLTATPANGYEFNSWNVTNTSTSEQIDVENNQFTMPASDVTVSATFSEVQQGGGDEIVGEYVLTAINQIDEEDEVVIVFTNSTASYAMSNDKGTSNAPTAVPVNINEYSISNPADNILWNVSYSNDDKTFIIYPKGSTAKWLYCINNNNGARVGTGENKVFSIDKNYLYNIGQSRYFGVYNNSDIRSYTLNNGEIGTNIAGQTLAFYVKKAAPKVLASISLSGEYQTEFIQNQEFNHAGVGVTATYEDESTKDVTAKATFSEPDMTTTGTKTVTVSYTEDEITKTTTYDINVTAEELVSISLGGNYTTNFEQNGTFNHDGLTVTAHYNSGRTADVTNDASFSTPNMSNLGEQTITVSYGGQEATYTIKVAGYYTVTIDNTHDTNGTISVWNGDVELESGAQVLDGTVLTIECAPADGYKYKNWQYKDKGDWTTKYTNYEYSVNGYNVSFRANFEEIPLYTITYYVNGVPTAEEVREGAALNFPENPTLAGKVFRGWITEPKITEDTKYNEATGEPEYVSTIGSVTGDCTYFAVFATATIKEGSTGTDVWEKVPHDFTGWTEAANKDNQYLIVSEDTRVAGKGYAFVGNGDRGSYREVTIVDNKINDDTENPFVYITMRTLNTTHIGFVIHGSANDGKLMGNQGENNLYTYDFNDAQQLSGITTAYANNDIAVNSFNNVGDKFSGQWSVRGYRSQGYTYLRYNTSEPFFRYYKTETTGNPVEFYMKKPATETTTTYSDFTTNMDEVSIAEACVDSKSGLHYGTYSNEKSFVVPSNMTVAVVGIDETDKTIIVEPLEKGKAVPANTGVMISSENFGKHYFAYAIDETVAEPKTTNYLHPSSESMETVEGDNLFYKLTMHNGTQIGFWWGAAEGVAFTMGKNKAYLAVPKAVANSIKSSMWVDEEGTLTEIDNIEFTPADNTIYNLQGQRINRADKGVYIVNGRKVIR